MSKEDALRDVKEFPVAEAMMSFWTIKSKAEGGYSARSINIDDQIKSQLRRVAKKSIDNLTEVEDYTLIAQNNEVSCLHVGVDETTFSDISRLVDEAADEEVIRNMKELLNSLAYVVRFFHEGKSFYCVKRVGNDWIAKKKRGLNSVVFRENKLTLIEEPTLVIYDNYDFYVLGEHVLVAGKKSFETILKYKATYVQSLDKLKVESEFVDIFSDMKPLLDFVGNNTMHLRRIAVIAERGWYKDAAYMQRLKDVNAREGWNIVYDANGKIVPCSDSVKTIMKVLLNHRLFSELSLTSYDVPSASQLGAGV